MLFAVDLLIRNHWLWIWCGVFAIGPHLISNVIGLVVAAAWQDKSVRLRAYLSSYQWVMIAISVFSGFYVSVDICKSKLFYWRGFSMQIKKSEYQSVKLIRFFNIVILEVWFPFPFLVLFLCTRHLPNKTNLFLWLNYRIFRSL